MPRFFLLIIISLIVPLGAEEWIPFSLPWNDASPGITDLSDLSEKPAGKYGVITIDRNGHFAEGDHRIRFLGVNIAGSGCFPSNEDARQIAGRLAKFGINTVRFHHMDAHWEKNNVLVDYTAGGSAKLSADRLDKLHYFVSALKKHGIYSNINLIVSHNYSSQDGFPKELDSMDWKDKLLLSFFSDRMLELEKKFATDLLTSKNPYTELPLVDDPAVAFVEILNEHGLIHEWMTKTLDSLPQVFRNELQKKWNDWLKQKYSTDDNLTKAWKIVDSPLGSNRLTNGDFSQKVSSWNFEKHDKAAATITFDNSFNGKPAACIDVTTPGSANWHVQLNQGKLSFSTNEIYTVSFWAKTSVPESISCSLQDAGDYQARDFQGSWKIGSEWTLCTQTFLTTTNEQKLRLNFGGFGNKTIKVWIADVKFQKGGKFGSWPEVTSLAKNNVPILDRNPSNASYTPAMKEDFIRFLYDLERRYWNAMRDHVKKTLGFKGIVIGTAIPYSTPGIQADMDAIDSHAYWAHPSFPGKPWDGNNWRIETRSMVDAIQKSTIPRLAMSRIDGKPFTVTEYQHASPNVFSSEAPLFVAAYGAFQDWDGIWLFDYGKNNKEWNVDHILGYFDMNTHPTKMANMLLAAALFRRGDVSPGKNLSLFKLTTEDEIQKYSQNGNPWNLLPPSGIAPLTRRVALDIRPEAQEKPDNIAPLASSTQTNGNEITWDGSGKNALLVVNTPRTKVLVGIPAKKLDFDGISMEALRTDEWLTAGISIRESDRTFTDPRGWSARVILTGKTENTEMGWQTPEKNFLGTKWGKAPVLVNVIPIRITLPIASNRIQIFSLDEKGQRKKSIDAKGTSTETSVILGDQSAPSIWYEIVVSTK